MIKHFKNFLLPFPLLLAISVFLLFRKFFLEGLIPFPGNFLFAWFEPWKSLTWTGTAIGIPHKPIGADIFRVLYPLKDLGISLFKEGQWPLWNPYNFSGTPLLAEFQATLLNPLNIIFFFTNFVDAWAWFIIFQPLLGGIVMYLFAKEISLSKISASLTSLTWIFSGFMIVWLEYGNFGYVVILLPLILLGIEKLFKQKSLFPLILITVGVALSLVSGHPHPTSYVLGFSLIYASYHFLVSFVHNKKEALVKITLFGFAFILGFLTSAVQLLPTYELYKQSAFDVASAKFIFEKFLLPPKHLITLFIPDFFGNRATYNFWGFYDYAETMIYTGIVPLLLAIFAAFTVKNKSVKFFTLSALISASLAYNLPTTKFLVSLNLPVFSTNVPSRIFLITTFCLSILAGFGLDYWLKNLKDPNLYRKLIRIGFPIIIFYVVILIFSFFADKFFYCQKGELEKCWQVAFKNTILPFISFTSASTVLLVPKILPKVKNLSLLFLYAIFIVNAIYFSDKFLSFSKKEYTLPVVPIASYLKENAGIDRIFGFADANIAGNFATAFKIFATEGYDPLYLRRYGELINAAGNNGVIPAVVPRADASLDKGGKTSLIEDDFRRKRILNLTGVKHILNKKSSTLEIPIEKKFPPDKYGLVKEIDDWQVYINNESLPRIFLTDKYEIEKDKNLIISKIFDQEFDLKTLILEEPPPNLPLKQDTQSVIKINSYTPNKINLSVTTSTNQLLFLSDTFYTGWKATIDDQKTKIYRAHYTFRAIVVPQGKHQVVFSYEPAFFQLGLKTSFFSLLFLLILTIIFSTKSVFSLWRNNAKV